MTIQIWAYRALKPKQGCSYTSLALKPCIACQTINFSGTQSTELTSIRGFLINKVEANLA